MSYTKAQREAKTEAALPHLVIEHKRMYLVQRLAGCGQVKVDATGLYYFLKEMFTTDWEKTPKYGRHSHDTTINSTDVELRKYERSRDE